MRKRQSRFLRPCQQCGEVFLATPSHVAIGKDKFCGRSCYANSIKGKRLSSETEFKPGQMTGADNPRWKEKITYGALHDWVNSRLGKAKECTRCGKTSNRIHWANISQEYRRDLNDFVSLCASCHKLYDLGKIELELA